jgi:hypothetical protein
VSETDQRTSQLDRIEASLISIEAKLAKFEQAAAGFLAGPAIGKMFGALKGNGKG